MHNVIERLKKIPMPVWIGLGLIILFILFTTRKSGTPSAGPVTGATVGTQGSQAGAGTDQQLGNLSQMFQTGFTDLAKQNRENTDSIIAAMQGSAGTTMHQIGSGIQSSQNELAGNIAGASGVLGGYGSEVNGNTFAGVPGASTQHHGQAPSAGGSGDVVNYSGHSYDLSTSEGRAQLTSDAANNVVPSGPGGTYISRLINGTG